MSIELMTAGAQMMSMMQARVDELKARNKLKGKHTMTDKIKERLYALIDKELNTDAPITSESTFESLGADSLEKLSLVMAVEQEFSLEIPEQVSAGWTTVGEVEKHLAEKL